MTTLDPLTLLLAALAVYRLATDLAWEDGPGGLFARARGAIIQRYRVEHWLSDGVTCPICLSFWIALPAAFVWGALAWLGIAGAAAFLARVTT